MKYTTPIIKLIYVTFAYLLFSSCQVIKLNNSPTLDDSEIILFNGKSLDQWERTDFAGKGEIFINEKGNLVLEMGAELSGLHWKGDPLPKSNYEISLQAKRTLGSDFFCGLTFPFKESHATLILGGWGGSLIGISSLDDFDASENETGDAYVFEDNQWYDIKLRVTDEEFTVWIDEKSVIDCEVVGRKVAMRPGEIEMSIPLGLCTFATTAEIKNMTLRIL
jgi:hypothetical protein|tara:strand:+ start:105 stop:767 length:663 start_codon:yes stop_codon:yes gene_type:complete